METPKKHEFVQIKNPRTKYWVKVDKTSGRIYSTGSKKPLKDIPIIL